MSGLDVAELERVNAKARTTAPASWLTHAELVTEVEQRRREIRTCVDLLNRCTEALRDGLPANHGLYAELRDLGYGSETPV